MRISRFFARLFVLSALIFLPGCGGGPGPEELAGQVQESFLASQEILFAADIRADYGDRTCDYSVSFEYGPDGGVMTVAEPAIIAGVTVRFTADGATLSYDGAEVFTGEILPGGMSPVEAVPMLPGLWRDGLVTEAVFEKLNGEECLAVLFRVDERVESRTWFSKDAWLPLRSEVYLDGYTVIGCDFYNVRAE